MTKKIYILLLAFLPWVTLCSTEAEMYNIYLLNVFMAIFTFSATILSLQKGWCMTISRLDAILIAFVIISLLCAIKGNAPIHPYIYYNLFLTILFVIVSKNIIQRHISLLCKALYCNVISLTVVIIVFFFSTDYENFVVTINNKMGNTGICSIFLAISICMMLYTRHYVISRVINVLLYILSLLCILIIHKSECRTAYFTLILYCISGLFSKNLVSIQKAFKSRQYFFRLATILFLLISCFFITQTNQLKENSLHGRYFILLNSIKMFCDSPLTGQGGIGSFSAKYPLYQAEWFSAHPTMDKTFYLADNVMYASNEYVQILSEMGICGIIVISLFLFYTLSSIRKYDYLNRCLLLPILIASLSYYILHVTFFCAISLIICIVVSCRCKKRIAINGSSTKMLLSIIMVFSIILTSYNVRHYHESKKIRGVMETGHITHTQALDVLDRYSENHYLMALLSSVYKDPTDKVYHCIERNFLHSDMLFAEGESLILMGNDSIAERKLLLASQIVPNRFRYPHRLMRLYHKQNDTLKCRNIAKKIQLMPVKIPSPIVTAIKKEAEITLNDY